MPAKFHDYYQVLGVQRSASADEIQRAYRDLARKYHPDMNKEKGAEERFKEIGEAYEVLKDADKRKRYDALGANWKHGQEFQPPQGWGGGARSGRRGGPGGAGGAGGNVHVDFGEGGADFSDFFESLFGGGGARAGRSGFGGMSGDDFADAMRGGAAGGRAARHGRSRARPGQTHEAEITIPLRDAFHGATRNITLTSSDDDGASSQKTYDVKIPAGVTDGAVIRLSGQGGPGMGGGEAGDLLLRIQIAPDPRFRFDPASKHDLITTVPIAPWEAALGGKVHVETLGGDLTMTIPPGSQSGQKLRIRGKGFPRKNADPGDLFAELKIVVPRTLTPEERTLYEQLRDQSNFDPRTT